ncbi:hypothetical protein BUALT_Bualt10G0032700 [Buddleja alternifolia]|uniref:Uncharacterized protein n=1 Tax=Buddleja alternifolia TaxID=168488 RepID=A0AAV6X3T7_9LAMI|nr:hypothetical protein BUALT_Bualt10G0032700 [Buddleja alternifolia]
MDEIQRQMKSDLAEIRAMMSEALNMMRIHAAAHTGTATAAATLSTCESSDTTPLQLQQTLDACNETDVITPSINYIPTVASHPKQPISPARPVCPELVEKVSKGELPKNDYPCMNDPSPTFHGTSQAAPVRTGQVPAPHSMRSRRTATWARPRNSDDGYSSDSILRHASSDFKKMGQRIFVFIVGGATRSELRVCHKLSTKLKREIILGSSSLDDPPQFIT